MCVCVERCWTRTHVGRSSVAKRVLKTAASTFLLAASQPSASFQEAFTASILTLPDSVRRRPTLSHSCANCTPGRSVLTTPATMCSPAY